MKTELLNWYDSYARELPWRVSPKDRKSGIMPDPYSVWLSEIMLQQTTVATVKDYFRKFKHRWPGIEDLSASTEDDVLRAWAGLGYYSRARNLKKCADIIVEKYNGQFPRTVNELCSLPGIGDYTSAAIASIAFDAPAAVMDGNVERVFSRLFMIDTPLPAAKTLIKAKVTDHLDTERPGDFAQATMDLGAIICTPKKPACLHCPIQPYCVGFAKTDPEKLPVKAPKKQKSKRMGAAYIAISSKNEILLEQRANKGLLASMTQVPTTAWNARHDGATGKESAPFEADWHMCGKINHVFTHFELELTIWRAGNVDQMHDNSWWQPINRLDGEALPTVMKKAISCAIPSAFNK